jgi:hypothetical protein
MTGSKSKRSPARDRADQRQALASPLLLFDEPLRADGRAWQHSRALDGNVYEIIGPDALGDVADETAQLTDSLIAIATHHAARPPF